jgi:PleD family two-component response regulator
MPARHGPHPDRREKTVIKPKVLLVNDHPASLMALESVLVRKQVETDYEVVTAQSGQEALRYVLQQQFAVICSTSACPAWMVSKPRRSSIPTRARRRCRSFS